MLVLGPLLASVGVQAGWYDTDWQFRKKITLDRTEVAANLTDFPVLINLTTDAELAASAQNDGDDILFTSSDETTKISHEIEFFDGGTGELVAWVKVPTVSASVDTDIYMYYGNATVGSQQDAVNVWDANYVQVSHLKETPNGTLDELLDSSGSGNHGQTFGMGASNSVDAKAGKGLNFVRADALDQIRVYDSASLDGTADEGTLEFWVNFVAVPPPSTYYILMTHSLRFSTNRGMEHAWTTGGNFFMYPNAGDSGGGTWSGTDQHGFVAGQWHHVVWRWKRVPGKDHDLFTDGGMVAFNIGDNSANWTEDASIDDWYFGGNADRNDRWLDGKMDEIRVSNIMRSDAWISTEHSNQSAPGSFYTLAAQVPAPTADLTVTKTVDDATPTEGDTVVYTVVLDNDGPDTTDNVAVTDLLPSGVTYVSDVATTGSYVSGTGVWTVGSMANGASATLTITVTVDPGTATSTIVNTAGVSASDLTDPTAGNDSDTADITVQTADLSLAKTDGPDPAPIDGPLVYTLLVTNNGPHAATTVTLTDILPASVTLVSATPSQGSCSGTTTVTCSLGTILNTGTASVEILVVTSGAGTITNNASVTAQEIDLVPGNNAAAENTDVVASGTSDVPLTQYRRIHGFVDSTVTGGTLRTQPNSVDPCAVGPSSSETLSGIPATSTVVGAYLYWAGSGTAVDGAVTFDGSAVTADRTFQAQFNLGVTSYDFFGGFEDVTAQVDAKRNGSYSFADLTVDTANPFCKAKAVVAGWTLLVVYEDSGVSGKTLVLYDGFDLERNGSTSYLLAGIFAADPPEAKSIFLVWEGDVDLGGANEKLEFNAGAQSDGLNPVNNVYNSTINSLGSSTSYGVDFDSFDVTSEMTAGDTLATMGVFTGPDLVVLNAVMLQVKSNIITGNVFEDVNYGGGAGRNLATAVAAAPSFAVGRPGATVELYDALGTFTATTTTDASGLYGFAGLIDGDYTVRVVNDTVTSSRPGGTGSEWPVQTYRTDASTGATVPITNEVGGADLTAQDDPANGGSDSLSTLTAQSLSAAKIVTGLAVTQVDFGFNFDTIVNTNDSGQGSLRQFILNSNSLTNANLDQDDAPVGVSAVTKNPGNEHSIFMVPATELVPTIDGGGGTVLLIQPSSGLESITGADTAFDGRTQTALTGDTNGAVAEVTTGPEVIVDLRGAVAAEVLTVRGNNTIVDSVGLTGALGVGRDGIDAGSLNGAQFRNDTIFDNGAHGIYLAAVTGTNISNSVIRNNGVAETTADGVLLTGGTTGNTISGNEIIANAAFGVDLTPAVVNSNTITGNLIKGNGVSVSDENAGIKIDGSDNSSITLNTITENAGDGVVITSGDTGTLISQNSVFNNGELGIDLGLDSNNGGDGVTLNDDPDMPGGGNNRQNFPVITSAIWDGVDTVVKGTLTSTVGATFDIEIFSSGVCNGAVSGSPQADTYGEGETYRVTANVTDGDSDGIVTFSANVPANLTGLQVTATATDTANNDSSEFSACYSAATLSIVKRAFQSDGTPIASGSTLPTGMPVKFMLYLNNPGGLLADISLRDVLDPVFLYFSGSIRYDNSVANCGSSFCNAAEEAAIFAAAESGTVGTDAVNGDVVSFTGVTLDVGNQSAANAQLDLAGGKVWAVVFTVTMQ